MSLRAYVLILFAVSSVFYFAGYKSLLYDTLTGNVSGDFAANLINSLGNMFTNPLFLSLLVTTTVSSFVGGGNFSVIYIIPVIILVIFANAFIFPISFMFDSDLPSVMKVFLTSFFALFQALAVIEFVRGSA